MAEKRKVEVFTAGCDICDEAVKTVKDLACPSCEVIVYDLSSRCTDCGDKAKEYGIRSIPAVVVDGKLADCCKEGGINIDALKASGVGQPL